MFKNRQNVLSPFKLLLIIFLFNFGRLQASSRPNIILIFCDDLGYGDLGCYGSTIHHTPNIDRLAQNGVRFTDFYVAANVCSPSRASLLTGCYPQRIDMHVNEKPPTEFRAVLQPMSPKGLNPDETTIADILKALGYATTCIGKWHVGDQPDFLPKHYGFDSFYGISYSHNMNPENCPLQLIDDDSIVGPVDVALLTQQMTKRAIDFISEHKETPFFLYLPHPMPHFPLDASESFKGQSRDGIYGDAVEEIDWSVGQIVETLEVHNLSDNTMIIFTSDNGGEGRWGPNKGGLNHPLRGHKGTTWEGGMRVPCIMQWPGQIPPNAECDKLITAMDFLPTFAAITGHKSPTAAIDGVDISSLLKNPKHAKSPHDYFLYYEKDQLQAVRQGQWKLHLALEEKYPAAWRNDTVPFANDELYDLKRDMTESWNVADQHPDIVARMKKVAEHARQTLGDRNRTGSKMRKAAYRKYPICINAIGQQGNSKK